MREMLFERRRQIDYATAQARACVFDNDTRRGSVFFFTTPIVGSLMVFRPPVAEVLVVVVVFDVCTRAPARTIGLL